MVHIERKASIERHKGGYGYRENWLKEMNKVTGREGSRVVCGSK